MVAATVNGGKENGIERGGHEFVCGSIVGGQGERALGREGKGRMPSSETLVMGNVL